MAIGPVPVPVIGKESDCALASQRRSLMTRFQAGGKPEASTYVELPEDHHVDGVQVGETLAGDTLAGARVRERFGVTVLMIRRPRADGGEIRLAPALINARVRDGIYKQRA